MKWFLSILVVVAGTVAAAGALTAAPSPSGGRAANEVSTEREKPCHATSEHTRKQAGKDDTHADSGGKVNLKRDEDEGDDCSDD